MNKALLLAFSIIFVSCNAIKLDYDYITSSNQEIKSSLSKIDKKNWHNLDIEKDSVPGTSVERAYNELLNELKGKKVTAGQLGRVYKKGLAAYRTGHRPGTSPNQWAMARVNSVLTGGKAAKVDAHIFGKGKKPKKKETKKKT